MATCHPDRKHYSKGLCDRCRRAAWAKSNPDKVRASQYAWAKKNPDKVKIIIAKSHKKHEESVKAGLRAWRQANPDKVRKKFAEYYEKNREQIIVDRRAWRKANPDKVNAQSAKRRSAKLQRTPPWITKEQLKEIQEFYSLAKELQWLSEEPLTVDHIIPLQGKNVSGLNLPWNLQILPQSLNISKGNRI